MYKIFLRIAYSIQKLCVSVPQLDLVVFKLFINLFRTGFCPISIVAQEVVNFEVTRAQFVLPQHQK
jgi:hypothetical protein